MHKTLAQVNTDLRAKAASRGTLIDIGDLHAFELENVALDAMRSHRTVAEIADLISCA